MPVRGVRRSASFSPLPVFWNDWHSRYGILSVSFLSSQGPRFMHRNSFLVVLRCLFRIFVSSCLSMGRFVCTHHHTASVPSLHVARPSLSSHPSFSHHAFLSTSTRATLDTGPPRSHLRLCPRCPSIIRRFSASFPATVRPKPIPFFSSVFSFLFFIRFFISFRIWNEETKGKAVPHTKQKRTRWPRHRSK